METLIQQALAKGIISFDSEQKYITYTHQNKKRNFQNPEEKVQAETYCKLILQYGYPEKCIQQFVAVKMGVSDKEADIVVYNDEECTKPYIIAECKSEDISELEFQEAVKQAFSYAHALAGTSKYVWVTKGNKEEFYKFDKEKNTKEPIAEIPYFGESETKKYRFAKGGFYKDKVQGKETTIKIQDIQPISENELTKLFKQAHDALWAGGELNPSEAFDELDKLIFCKVWDEKNTKKGEPYQFQVLNEEAENLKKRINELYDKGKVKDPEVFNKPIDLTAERIKTIVEYFQKISLSETDLDNKGKAFETFLGTYFRGEFGAYFTPRTIVKFAVEALPIINESRVLDTSCGSGGFLLYVLDKVRRQATEIYTDYENDTREYKDWFAHWHDFAEKNLFGIEINEQISRVAKMNMIIHDDGHTNVIQHDGLYEIEVMAKKNKGFAANSFDFIVTNPPFGSIVKQSEKAYMQTEKNTAPYYDFSLKEVNWIDKIAKGSHLTTGRENQSTEVLFIEQIHKFLRAGGYLAVVIPDGILTNSSLGYVREGIEEKFRIVAVVSLPQTAFTNTGAGVKSSVLFLKKYDEKTTQEIKKAKDKIISLLDNQKQIKKTIDALDAEKKQAIKTLTAKDEETQLQKKIITDDYNERINNFKEELNEHYETEKQRQLPDYPIFMAIAENIGYDATGKNTQKVIEIDENATIKLSPQALFGRHCAIVGTTGGGKSYTVTKLLEEISKNNGKAIVIDATGEYETLKDNSKVKYVKFNDGDGSLYFHYSGLRETDLSALFRPAGQVQLPKLQSAYKSLRLHKELISKDNQEEILEDEKIWLTSRNYLKKSDVLRDPAYYTIEKKYISIIDSIKCDFDITKLAYQVYHECIYESGWASDDPKKDKSKHFGGKNDTELGHCSSLISRINVTLKNNSFINVLVLAKQKEMKMILSLFLKAL